MCSEDEGVCHLPSYLLDSLTKFLREIVDPTIVRSKPMVLFVEGKFVKTLPSCLWVKKKCCDIVTWMILTFFRYMLALKILTATWNPRKEIFMHYYYDIDTATISFNGCFIYHCLIIILFLYLDSWNGIYSHCQLKVLFQ